MDETKADAAERANNIRYAALLQEKAYWYRRHSGIVHPDDRKAVNFMDTHYVLSENQLMQLMELAEDELITRYEEFSESPTNDERELMLSLYRLVEKDVSIYFARIFGWAK